MESSKPIHILNIKSTEDKENVLNSFDVVLSDIEEGIFCRKRKPIKRIPIAICLLRSAGKLVKFVTDDTLHIDEYFLEKLTEYGVTDVTENDLMYPARAMCYYVGRKNSDESVVSLCTPKTNKMISKYLNVLALEGIRYLVLRPDNLLTAVQRDSKVVAVLLDTNFDLTYADLSRAQQYLDHNGCSLLVGSLDAFVKIDKGFRTLGNGGLINMLSQSSNKEPLLMNKQGPILAELICQQYNVSEPHRVLMVGTSLTADIEFGKRSGFQTLLLLTKKTVNIDLTGLNDKHRPDYVANSYADLIHLFTRKRHCWPPIEAQPEVVKPCCTPRAPY